MADGLVISYAVYRADKAGPVDNDDGVTSICVAVFGDVEEAIAEASLYLREGYSVSVDIGMMTRAEWDALEEVPDDFTFEPDPAPVSLAVDAVDPHVANSGTPSTRV